MPLRHLTCPRGERAGAVSSALRVSVNGALSQLPALSVAEHVTVVAPALNVLPLAGEQLT